VTEESKVQLLRQVKVRKEQTLSYRGWAQTKVKFSKLFSV